MLSIHYKNHFNFIFLFLVGILLFNIPINGLANTSSNQAPDINAKSALSIDPKTKQILYSKDANQKLPAASTSKLLAIYVILQNIHQGKLSWNQQVKITPQIHNLSMNSNYTNVPLSTNRTYSVKDLYQASLIYSANAAVMSLGQQVAGSQHAFVSKMKTTAKNLGIHNIKLYNACGLTNDEVGDLGYHNISGNAENELSANDLGIIASNLVDQYPEVLKTTSIKSEEFNGTEMNNWNWMLKGNSQSQDNLPVDGLKTGTSDAAGANFIGTAHKNGHRILTVIMHASHNSASDPSRFVQTKNLMNYTYDNYRYIDYHKHQILPIHSIYVPNGKQKEVSIQSARNVHYWQLKNNSKRIYQIKINHGLQDKNGVSAPITKQSIIGDLMMPSNKNKINYLKNSNMSIPIQTMNDVHKANFFVRSWRTITNLF